MIAKHEESKRNDSPQTIDEKTTITNGAYQPKKTKEKIGCDGKPSYTILEQGYLERSLLMMKNPTQPN